jgi:hypothetical protein
MTTDPASSTGWLTVSAVYVWAVLEQLHPGSAMGASFGCVFFILLPDPVVSSWFLKLIRKIGLTIVSWGFGYAVGIAFSSNSSMLVAVIGAAVASGVLGAINLMVKNDGDLPQWMSSLINAILRLKRGGDEQ